MPDGASRGGGTLTVPLDDATAAALAALSERVGRTPEEIAAEAIIAYAAREARIVEAIERGRADARAGRVTPHEEAMRRMWRVLEEEPVAR